MELEQLYRDIYPKMYAFFYANTSSREAAEDLTQDVFFDALRGGACVCREVQCRHLVVRHRPQQTEPLLPVQKVQDPIGRQTGE